MSASNKKKKGNRKFKGIIIAIIAALICVSTIIGCVGYVRMMSVSLWSQLVRDITEVTKQGGYAFETFLNKETESINALVRNLQEYEFDDEQQRQDVLKLFDMNATSDSYFTLIVYDQPATSDKCTLYLANNGETERLVSLVDKASYADYAESGISNVYYNMYTGKKSIAYYQRFQFKDGREAIIRKGQDISDIGDMFSLSFYDNSGFSYITKNDGEIVLRPSHPNSNRTSKTIFYFLSNSENSNEKIDNLKESMQQGKAGSLFLKEGKTEIVLSFIPLSNTNNWYIVSVIPNEAISENIENILRSTTAMAWIISLIVVMMAMFLVSVYIFRKKTAAQEAEVKYREQLFNILANNTDDVFIMMPHGSSEAEYISPNIERVIGYKEKDAMQDLHIISKSLRDLQVEDGLNVAKNLEENSMVSYASERQHKITGETKYFLETVYRASIEGVQKDIVVLSDRTEERKAEAKLTEAMEAANAANQAKSTFLSSMSHDIRTPMNAIIGMTNIATKHIEDKERVKDCLAKIAMSSNHLLTLINDVLDLSKIESGKITLSPVVFSLRDVVTNLVNIVRPQINEKHLGFDIHINNVAYEYLYADVLRINQVFINILSNAVKYTPNGGKIAVDLAETVLEKDKKVRLTYIVKDTGMGMSKEYMKTMYDTFSRAENSRTNAIQGTGLGLAIVKQMVTLMNGTIDCESEVDKGTTFTIVLDLPVSQSPTEKLTLPPIKVLIVDDDEIFLESASDTMSELGVTVDTAHSGQKALEMLQHSKDYSAIIVDWQMPHMSGLDTVKKIREIISHDIPVILASAYDWEDIQDEAQDSGVNGFISKPIFRSYIHEKLCDVLELNKTEEHSEAQMELDLSSVKILVAEDNMLNWEVISELLDMYGVSCDHAKNGKICVEMMEAAPKGTYDLILMDIQMPVMNGREATVAIRNSKKDYVKNIPILAMTADAFAEDIAACMDVGMNGHLSKPVDVDKLYQEIKRILFDKKDGE